MLLLCAVLSWNESFVALLIFMIRLNLTHLLLKYLIMEMGNRVELLMCRKQLMNYINTNLDQLFNQLLPLQQFPISIVRKRFISGRSRILDT